MDQHLSGQFWVDERYPSLSVEVGSGLIVYREAGPANGPVIVLLHGIGSGSGSWAYFLNRFQETHRLLAWDAPGYNLSTCLLEDSPGAVGYAHALGSFLEALVVAPAVVVGHSLGAMFAGAYAAEVNPLLPTLILADPANGYGAESEMIRDEKLNFRLDMVRKLGPNGMAEKRSGNLLTLSASAEAVEMVKWNMQKTTVRGYEQASRALAYGQLMGKAGEFKGRALVICGEEDSVTPVEACKLVAVAYSDAPFVELPGLGHASYVEGPDLFNAAVEKFLGLDHA